MIGINHQFVIKNTARPGQIEVIVMRQVDNSGFIGAGFKPDIQLISLCKLIGHFDIQGAGAANSL